MLHANNVLECDARSFSLERQLLRLKLVEASYALDFAIEVPLSGQSLGLTLLLPLRRTKIA
jgi:hypothetical protein